MSNAGDTKSPFFIDLPNLEIRPPLDSNAVNKRLKVKLAQHLNDVTGATARKIWGGDAVIKQTLNALWNKFGAVSDVSYDADYSYCFLLFPSHDSASAALSSLNSEPQLQEAINEIVQDKDEDANAQELVTQITSRFVLQATILSENRASWARPHSHRRSRGRSAYGDVFSKMGCFDDCPIGEDRNDGNSFL